MLLKSKSGTALVKGVRMLGFRNKFSLSAISRIQRFSSFDTNHEKESLSIRKSYTADQQVEILNKINTCSLHELQRFSITEARLKKLTAYRDKYGSFKSINEVLLLQGIDVSVLDKFCKSIVKGESAAKNKLVYNKGDLLTPALDNNVKTAINTITGIWVYGNSISWAQVDRSGNLLNWECESLGEVAMKDGILAVVEAVARVVSKVPESNAYTLEGDPIIPFSRMNTVAYYLQLQRQQIVSTFVSLLGTRERRFAGNNLESSVINNIYIMRSRAPARIFDLLIGSEIVSAKSVVKSILSDTNEDATIYMNADSAVRENYNSRDIYEQEQMNWALLLTATFLNVSILENPDLQKSGKRARQLKSTDSNKLNE